MEESEKGQKVPKDLLHLECFKCKLPGHYSTLKECPLHPENKKNKAKAGFINITWADADTCIFAMIQIENDLEEHVIDNAVHVSQGLLPTKVLLDNQANFSIVHPMLLTNVRTAPKKIRVKCVGEPQLFVDIVGHLQGFLKCTQVSILRQHTEFRRRNRPVLDHVQKRTSIYCAYGR